MRDWLRVFERNKGRLLGAVLIACCACVRAQIPDLVDAFDAGSRAMGMGGATEVTDSDTLSIHNNPAGLGFVTSPTLGLSLRNLPSSRSTFSGDLQMPSISTDLMQGRNAISHFGVAYPFRGGALGLSYATVGLVDDEASAASLSEGGLLAVNYQEKLYSKTDFITLAYGRSTKGGRLNFGLGLIYARRSFDASLSYQLFDEEGADRGGVNSEAEGSLTGFGLVAGVQFLPGQSSDLSVGVSIRTPIEWSGDEAAKSASGRMPGRASIGVAKRLDNIGKGADFLVLGAQVNYFFGADASSLLGDLNGMGFGIGAEYSMHRMGGRIPIRLGFLTAPSRGGRFDDRTAITFGLGYRPNSNRFGVDLSIVSPTNGGQYELALTVTYRLENR